MEIDNQPNPQQQGPPNQIGPNPGPAPGPMPGPTQNPMQGPASGPMPPQPPQPMNGPMGPGPQQYPQPENKTDVLGIISLIMILVFPLLGMILGFIGVRKAKKEGYSKTLSMVGAIINTIIVVLGILAIVAIFVLAANSDISNTDDFNDFQTITEPNENEAYEVSFVSEIGNICEGDGWPTNLKTSSGGNVIGVFSNKATFPESYTTEYLSLEDEYESVESSSPTTIDKVVCVSSVGQEPIKVMQCDLEIDDEPVKAPMSLRPFKATVYDVGSKAEVASFTAQPEERCPFFVTVDPSDNSFDAGIDEDSFNAELAKVI